MSADAGAQRSTPARTATVSLVAAATVVGPADAPLLPQLTSPPPGLGEQLARMDRLCGLALVASERLRAKLPPSLFIEAERTAVLCGSTQGCLATDAAFYRGVLQGEPSPRLFAYTLHSSPIGAVSIQYGYCGPGLSLVGSAIGGMQALAEAQTLLLHGQAQSCWVLSCDVASDRNGQDRAAALLLQVASTTAESPDIALHVVQDAFVPAQSQRALSSVIAAMRSHAGSESGATAPIVFASAPPLLLLAELAQAELRPTSLPLGPSGQLIVASSDPKGYAAAALLSMGKRAAQKTG